MKKFILSLTLVVTATISISLLLFVGFFSILVYVTMGSALIKLIGYLSINFVISYSIIGLLVFGTILCYSKNTYFKAVSFNFLFFFTLVISLENYLNYKESKGSIGEIKIENTPGTIKVHQRVVGFAPAKNSVDTVRFFVNDSLVWKQIYTIDKNGQRIMPTYTPNATDNRSILFFGCSVTFGVGLRDEGAFPYKVGEIFKNKFRVYNFAYGGYGTHQALSILEHHLDDSIVEYKPAYCIYLAIPDHVNRIIDIKDWGHDGPKYLLDENGVPKFRGYFYDQPLTPEEKLRNKLLESGIYKFFCGNEGRGKDADLFIAMVDKMRSVIHDKYPDCEFHVLYWEDEKWNSFGKNLCDRIQDRLKQKKDWKIHYISSIVPDYLNHKHQLFYPYDSHPKEYVNDTIARYIARNIVKLR